MEVTQCNTGCVDVVEKKKNRFDKYGPGSRVICKVIHSLGQNHFLALKALVNTLEQITPETPCNACDKTYPHCSSFHLCEGFKLENGPMVASSEDI